MNRLLPFGIITIDPNTYRFLGNNTVTCTFALFLKSFISGFTRECLLEVLQLVITGRGHNLRMGERQLICLIVTEFQLPWCYWSFSANRRAVEDKVKEIVSLDVYGKYFKEGGKAGCYVSVWINSVILPDGKSPSKHSPILHGISLIRLELRKFIQIKE